MSPDALPNPSPKPSPIASPSAPEPASRPPFRLDRFFAFRTPLLPYAELAAWNEGLSSAQAEEEEALSKAFEEDRRLLRARLQALVDRPDIREALFVASPDLVDSLPRWVKDPDSDKGQRTEMALVRYFNRMCHRPTPFGLFAGHSMGRMGGSTRLELGPRSAYRRSTRLDFNYLCGLVAEVQKDRELRSTLTYRPNNSLYRTAGRLRYAEARTKEGERDLHLVALTEDEFLLAALAKAKPGASLETLAASLVSDEIPLEEAQAFIHELIDNQVLVPDLEPATTGAEPLPELIRRLEGAASTRPVAERLAKAGQTLEALDAQGLGNPPDPYHHLAAGLEELPGKVERSKLWQVDLFKPAPEATLGRALQEELEGAIDLLRQLTPIRDFDPFKAFKEAFAKRYEQRWVPLVEALDPECGVGFSGAGGQTVLGAPILDGLTLGPGHAEGFGGGFGGGIGGGVGLPDKAPDLKGREVWLLKRLAELRQKGETILRLSEEDVASLKQGASGPFPASFSCMAEIAAPSAEALETGEFQIYLHGASGPTAARMLGRFCHGDPELAGEVVRHLKAEEASMPEARFAEIAHLPYGRLGNVLARPVFRGYEIPFLGAAGMDPDCCIEITDLFVGIAGNRVRLWSKKLNREIVPRLSSAANYSNRAVDLFRFLATMQDQAANSWMGWTWGGLGQEPWLPRVVHGKCVLSRAAWQVKPSDLKPMSAAKAPLERFKAFQQIRRTLGLPRQALLADGDNELPIDLDNPLSVEALWSLVKKRSGFKLLEDFPGGEGLVVKGAEGAFTHELVLACHGEPDRSGPVLEAPDLEESLDRHAPGSDWLYAKLYTGQATADQILAGAVAPLVEEVLAAGEADRWFFIRYSDPEPHVRLRFHGEPSRLWGSLLPRLQRTVAPLLQDGWIWKVALDTYEPETGRYGGSGNIERIERLFQADSEAVLDILALYPGDAGTDSRWRLAIRSVDEYYTCLGWGLEERKRVADISRAQFALEFSLGKGAEHRLGETFRKERKGLEALLDPAKDAESPLSAGIAALKKRTGRLLPLFADMLEQQEQGGLTHPLETLMASLVHMSVNRLLRSAQRMQEAVVYDFLVRLYESRLARDRRSGGLPVEQPGLGHQDRG